MWLHRMCKSAESAIGWAVVVWMLVAGALALSRLLGISN